MLVNGKISYSELEQLVFQIKGKVENSYLKKIFHYEGLWLFKFNHFQFVFEPGLNIWSIINTFRPYAIGSFSNYITQLR